MSDKLIGIIVIGMVGIFLVLARRFRNTDKDAGKGIAGGTIFAIIFWITDGG